LDEGRRGEDSVRGLREEKKIGDEDEECKVCQETKIKF